MACSEPIVFEPLAMERVWGGRRLEALYGKRLPHGAPIGESWEIVDREDAQSVVHQGPLRGTTLHELWTGRRGEIFGAEYEHEKSRRFPILIKLLDARERLSVQVHPPIHMAATLRGEPKTEMWYFADALPGSSIYAGLKKGVTRSQFESLLRDGRVEEALHVIPVESGDSIFIPSGRLHAIGEGNVIVEVQQNSDTTYRVFDWNRTGLDGRP
ncbi:MAG TPA: class I mannose-6-phosphate isomerase, partial [Terrimicrobiaceae bacterium]|nr:class I mannose-6-phosphate isomerase [Terrimicrobiaceae bacterium]